MRFAEVTSVALNVVGIALGATLCGYLIVEIFDIVMQCTY